MWQDAYEKFKFQPCKWLHKKLSMKYVILVLCLLFSSCATTSLFESCECKCEKCVDFVQQKMVIHCVGNF